MRLSNSLVVAAVAAAGLSAAASQAAVVYSGVVNLNVPGTFDGTYLNVVSGLATPTTTGNTNYDFNPFISTPGTSTSWSFFQPDGTGFGTVSTATTGGQAVNLPLGTPISSASIFQAGTTAAPAFNGVANALVGIRFIDEKGTTATTDDTNHFGWARVTLPTPTTTNPQAPGTIRDYAFESTPGAAILAGVVPEPTALAAVAAAGLLAVRRTRR